MDFGISIIHLSHFAVQSLNGTPYGDELTGSVTRNVVEE
jgi:hypothetical protein